MDLRKIISFGKNSYVVSLPKDWVQRNHLKKGNVLSVEEKDSELMLSSKKDFYREQSSIRIDIENHSQEEIISRLTNAYMSGYDIIEIISSKFKEDSNFVKSFLMNLSGLEIINQTNNKIVAKDLINIQEVSVPKLIKRMDMISRAMILDAILSLEGDDHSKSIYERDKELNRIFFLSQRIIKKSVNEPSLLKYFKTTPFHLIIENEVVDAIERIGDCLKRLSRFSKNIDITSKQRKELVEIMKLVHVDYLASITAFYKTDKETSHKLVCKRKELLEKCNTWLDTNISKTTHGKSIRKLSLIIENIKAMHIFIIYIAQANLMY